MGGEKAAYLAGLTSGVGSPPRGRGKAGRGDDLTGCPRITPAWAGKSQGHRADRGAEQDHPRMGGEKLLTCERIDFRLGSPPRGRGKGK